MDGGRKASEMDTKYEKGVMLGKGTFATVYKATEKETGKVVAIKKIDVGASKEGLHMTTLREIKLLRELSAGPYIVRLLDVFPHKRKLSLVFEFMDSDLEAVIKARTIVLSPAHVKAYMQLLLRALDYCHSRWVVHRDIKPNNMLVSAGGGFKLADFGLARIFGSPDRRMTNQVFARWYRPPELFFGATAYGASIDIWAAGCVFAELLLRRPWLPGTSDLDQLTRTFAALGTPSPETWPGCDALPTYVEFRPASSDALDLLAKLVSLDPSRRPSAAEALAHPYFTNDPPPTPGAQLPVPPPREDNPLQAPPQAARPPAPASKPARARDGAEAGAERPSKSVKVEASATVAAADGGGVPAMGLGTASPMIAVKT